MDKHDPAYEDAFKDWKSGMKYKEIAEKYAVTLSAVKSWATRDWKLRKVATGKKKSCNQKGCNARSKAQLGNQHAVGHGAPLRNQNNLKHRLYAGVYWDILSDDEKAMLENMDFSDEEDQLQQQIAMLSVREYADLWWLGVPACAAVAVRERLLFQVQSSRQGWAGRRFLPERREGTGRCRKHKVR